MNANEFMYFGDMDGVLCKWEDATPEEIEQDGFWLSRKPDLTALDAARIIHEKTGHFRVLSAAISDKAKAEKREWLRIWAPFLKDDEIIFTPNGVPKTERFLVKSPYHVLIDDYSQQLNTFHGIAIKFMNGKNGRHGTFKGPKVYFNDTGYEVAKQIMEFAVEEYSKKAHTA